MLYPAGRYMLTCTCQMSGGVTQTGYTTPATTIHTPARPEYNILNRLKSKLTDRHIDRQTSKCLKCEDVFVQQKTPTYFTN